jgi:hypothetical protein
MFFNFFKRYDLLTFSHEKESIEVFKEIGLREFKKVLFLDLEEKNPCFGIEYSTKFLFKKDTWYPYAHLYFQFVLNIKEWEFKQYHAWYDGPNCAYRFGPIVLYLSGIRDNCGKCRSDK